VPARAKKKACPDPPDTPATFDPAPPVESATVCDGVEVGAEIEIPEVVADLDVRESRWVGVDLSGRRFTGLHVRDTAFLHCDLSGAVLDQAVLARVTFTDCRLTGVVLSGTTLRDVRITDCRADLVNLRMARASFLWVQDSTLRGADLHQFRGTHCAFLGCDLAGADLDRADLTGAYLHGSTIDDVRGVLCLRGARISPDQQVPLGAAMLAALDVTVTEPP